jgi:hypoxanthine-DNA glycosylase
MPLKFAFPPSVDADTRLLILGSLPGDASIRQGEYYAHRGNAFWHLLGEVLGEDLRGAPYAMRLKRLRAQGVGLWDVIESAERAGSLDSSIGARNCAISARSPPACRCCARSPSTARPPPTMGGGSWATGPT